MSARGAVGDGWRWAATAGVVAAGFSMIALPWVRLDAAGSTAITSFIDLDWSVADGFSDLVFGLMSQWWQVVVFCGAALAGLWSNASDSGTGSDARWDPWEFAMFAGVCALVVFAAVRVLMITGDASRSLVGTGASMSPGYGMWVGAIGAGGALVAGWIARSTDHTH